MIITICIDTSGEAFSAEHGGAGPNVAAILRALAHEYGEGAIDPHEETYTSLHDTGGEKCGVLTHLERSR